jgi:8-oxo-dGTP pyrophosphatase MutT (NUDIX family)
MSWDGLPRLVWGDEMSVKHATASVFLFSRAPAGWRLGLIEHPRLGWLMIPGGHVEEDESQAQAALREVAEETGLAGIRLLEVPAPALPAGFPHERVAPPWWITEQPVPVDNHLSEPHTHLDHQYVAVTDVTEPVRSAAHPFGWYSPELLPGLEMCEDTRLLAEVLFSCIEDLADGRLDDVSAFQPFTAAAAL